MLTFFRKIRKVLLDSGRLSRYLLYAIGEVLLVMIGILLALQVSNWNENRKNNIKEKILLLGLKEEFQVNLNQLKTQISINNRNLETAVQLVDLMGQRKHNINDSIFSDIIMNIINSEVQFRPSTGFINQILNSGSLEFFKN